MDGHGYKNAHAESNGERQEGAVRNFLGNTPQRVVAELHRLTSELCSVIADGKSVKTVSQAVQGGRNSFCDVVRSADGSRRNTGSGMVKPMFNRPKPAIKLSGVGQLRM
jgi:hypothetical protein